MHMSKFAVISFVVLLGADSAYCVTTAGSAPNSQARLEELILLEKAFIDSFENLVQRMESRYLLISSVVEGFRAENEKANLDPEGYLSIPTNSFALIQRLYRDWPNWRTYTLGYNAAGIDLRNGTVSTSVSDLDFNETVMALSSFQLTEGLRVADLAKGNISGAQYDAHLSALDCYSMGYELFRNEEFSTASEWLSVALELYQEDPIYDIIQFTRVKVLKVYAESIRNERIWSEKEETKTLN